MLTDATKFYEFESQCCVTADEWNVTQSHVRFKCSITYESLLLNVALPVMQNSSHDAWNGAFL